MLKLEHFKAVKGCLRQFTAGLWCCDDKTRFMAALNLSVCLFAWLSAVNDEGFYINLHEMFENIHVLHQASDLYATNKTFQHPLTSFSVLTK